VKGGEWFLLGWFSGGFAGAIAVIVALALRDEGER